MPDEMNVTADEQKALDEAQAVLSEASAQDLNGLCDKWRRLERYLPIILAVVRRIPRFGSMIADLIQTLAQLANMACPVQPASASSSS